jgi:hypothetical protein
MKKKLTARSISALKAKAQRVEYWDSLLPGFGCRVSTNGAKRWFCKVRVNGKLLDYLTILNFCSKNFLVVEYLSRHQKYSSCIEKPTKSNGTTAGISNLY